ncbi:uncharacterized protein LAESUDRAFT_790301 [Laetiporus sulphureus 93-53]|uniref:Uncharacterized protein n=1 Tax=Laetiporus sulphureus 93-53 TaxID=1314785 RepID=A0A165CS27_9APHY|nr:uncharacterized protein LAESUDRAFT_790301 [Laetiporus sulphureus 93-53]KZT03339.1 hypothetical protein LAESUDRAFT_790301 [Laetiporus sulphureus 93-53]
MQLLHSPVCIISEDTDDFRATMHDTGTILSGSAAARLLLVDALWQLNDYDLYTPHSQWDVVLDYISNLLGFVIEYVIDASDEENQEQPYPWLKQGMDRMARITRPNIRVDLMRSHNESAFYPLCFFWSTITINTISTDAIVSAYPTHLLSHRSICSYTISDYR